VAGAYSGVNEPSCPIECGELVHQARTCYLVREDSAQRNSLEIA